MRIERPGAWRRPGGLARPLACLVAGLAMLLANLAPADDLLAAGDGRHLFVVRKAVETDGWEILHFDVEIGPETYRTVHRTSRRPEAIAAVGDQCVLVLAPVDANRPNRLAIAFRVVQHPVNDVWYADPPGQPAVLPPLPTGGALVGLATHESGCLAVWRPSQRQARGIARTPDEADGDSKAAPDAGETPDGSRRIGEAGGIEAWDGPGSGEWSPLPLPEGFDRAVRVIVGSSGLGGAGSAAVAWRMPDDAIEVARLDGGGWLQVPVSGERSGRLLAIASLPDRTLLAHRGEGRDVVIEDLLDADGGRGFATRPFASVSGVTGVATVVGTESGPWVVGLDGAEVSIRTLDRVSGAVTRDVVAAEVDPAGSLLEFPIYATLMLSVMVLAILFRPHIERRPARASGPLPAAGLFRRAAGLCIDLAPGMMVAVVAFGLEPAEFLEEVRAGDPGAAGPILFGVTVASVLAAAMEVAWGRSLGKLVVGLRVVDLDGAPATRTQRGLRAGLRFVVLMFWPIALVAILDPMGRGMPELLSRTVVVGRGPVPPPAPVEPPSSD